MPGIDNPFPSKKINPKKAPNLIFAGKLGAISLSFRRTFASFLTTNLNKTYSWFIKKPFRNTLYVSLVSMLMLGATVFTTKMHHPSSALKISIVNAWGDDNIAVWWPTNGVKVSGNQPFKAVDTTIALDKYQMTWQVDGGQLNTMDNNFTDYPHKQSSVDLSGWNWKGSGPYTLTFTATDYSGNTLGSYHEIVYIATNNTTTIVPAVATNKTTSSFVPVATASSPQTTSNASIDVWWPTTNSSLTGITPFKAMIKNYSVSDYSMYWQVDGGTLNELSNNYQDYPHKEASVDVSGWNWKGDGPYTITFIAKNNSGQQLAESVVPISIGHIQKISTTQTAPKPAVKITPRIQTTQSTPQPSTPASNNSILSNGQLYVDPHSDAANWVNSHRQSDPANAALMDKVAKGAETQWFGNWNGSVTQDVSNFVNAAAAQGDVATIVAYNIPNRDCGGYSAGGATADDYQQWVKQFAAGIHGHKTAVLLEPDAISQISCLSSSDLQTRYNLLKDAVSVIKSAGAAVYIDAGHPGWISVPEIVSRLNQAGINQADGFALNVSNFATTQSNIEYGQAISAQLGGKHFIIDTGRNGSGPSPDYQWCNPAGRSLGQLPTTNTGNPLVDAFLWVKGPSGSDGYCNNGPAAGVFFPDYALGLAKRAAW